MRARALLACLTFGAVLGCGMLAGIDSLEVDTCYDAGCSSDASSDGASDALSDVTNDAPIDAPKNDAGCPTTGIPMIAIPGTPKFCIDSTEVTFAAYKDFLTAKNGDISGQPSYCKFNTSYAPAAIGSGSLPVSGVDYCDALAYCKWAGKRLCGNATGGVLSQNSYHDPSACEWLYACSAGGTQLFSYGSSYTQGTCNTVLDASGPDPVANRPKCQGGFPGVYDMLGNLWELQDAPDTDASTSIIMGEGWTTTDPTFRCDTAFSVSLNYQANDVGFRCCAP